MVSLMRILVALLFVVAGLALLSLGIETPVSITSCSQLGNNGTNCSTTSASSLWAPLLELILGASGLGGGAILGYRAFKAVGAS